MLHFSVIVRILHGEDPAPLEALKRKYRAKVDELIGDDVRAQISKLKALEEHLADSDRLRDAIAVKSTRARLERLSVYDVAKELQNLMGGEQ